jgi:hypothetical protein
MERIGEALRDCFRAPGNNLFREVEGRLIGDAFQFCESNQVRTAELLGISRNVVRTLLKRYGLIADGLDRLEEHGGRRHDEQPLAARNRSAAANFRPDGVPGASCEYPLILSIFPFRRRTESFISGAFNPLM